MVPKTSSQFAIRLQRGVDEEHADIHLHLLSMGRSGLLVRNSRSGGVWGVEEQLAEPLPFPVEPRSFLLTITAYVDTYEIEVAGSSNISIKVRDGLPISSVTHLAIEAELSIRAIHIPVENMPRNLRLSLGNGAKVGDLFSIRGQPTEDAKSFMVNWQSGPAKFDDVLFQLNPRLDEGRVARNSRLDEEMGKEESTTEKPFSPQTPFQLGVGVTSLGFEALLDGQKWHTFEHRYDVASAKTLFLEGDMLPSAICIDSAQLNPPGTKNGINLKSRGVRLQQIYPELPLTSRITGGFEKGCLLLISGRTNAQPSRMQMTLQCGEGADDSDVALRYIAKWDDDGSPNITLNSREEDSWGQEVKARLDDGFFPGLPFDLQVARMEDGLHCFLDGVEHAHFPYRLEDTRPDHVTLCGDVEIQRLLLL